MASRDWTIQQEDTYILLHHVMHSKKCWHLHVHSCVVAAGMTTVMDGPESGPFNLGNPTEFTMLDLAKMVQDVVNPGIKIIYKENTADDPSRRKPDITKVNFVYTALCPGMSLATHIPGAEYSYPACCSEHSDRLTAAPACLAALLRSR